MAHMIVDLPFKGLKEAIIESFTLKIPNLFAQAL